MDTISQEAYTYNRTRDIGFADTMFDSRATNPHPAGFTEFKAWADGNKAALELLKQEVHPKVRKRLSTVQQTDWSKIYAAI